MNLSKHHYPFGSPMPSRSFSASSYRYGFNGQEKDDEIFSADGSAYSFEFREYDSRLNRFMAVDPLTKKYPELTPYQFASNTTIWAKELEGLEANYTSEPTPAPFGGGTTPAGTQSQSSGPRSESFMEDNHLVEGSTKASAIGVKTTVDIVSGSKLAPNQPQEDKIAGGMLGGHATLNLGEQGVFSFSNEVGKVGNHFFQNRVIKLTVCFITLRQRNFRTQQKENK